MQTAESEISMATVTPCRCPIEFHLDQDPIDLAVRAEDHAADVSSLLTEFPSSKTYEAAAAVLSCIDCTVRDLCIDTTSSIFTELGIDHPTVFSDNMRGTLVQAQLHVLSNIEKSTAEGYTRDSSQKVVQEVLKNPLLTHIAAGLIEQGAIINGAGLMRHNNIDFSLLSTNGIALAIRTSEVGTKRNQELNEMITKYWTKMLRMDVANDGSSTTFLNRCFLNQISSGKKFITQLSSLDSIYEFRPNGGRTKMRMFGKAVDAKDASSVVSANDSTERIVFINTIADAKSGEKGKTETFRHARNTASALGSNEDLLQSYRSANGLIRLVFS